MTPRFHRVGRGPHTVIALHGWFGDRLSFSPIEPYLDTDRYSYVFMDYRGYGDRLNCAGDFTIEETAQDALTLADALDLPRFSLLGHSMGAMAAERLACVAPERVRRLVLLAPVPACGLLCSEETRALQTQAATDPAARRAIIDRSTGKRLPAAWLDWKAQSSWQRSTPEAFAAYGRAWTETDFSQDILDRHPALIITGGHDPVFNRERMLRATLQWRPSAKLEILRDAGHYPMNETPLALISLLENFLE
ncbi:alpha/beta fold hydrolase [Chromobacterium sp. IIBBL 290-4]|uniref:alpha/beta fold hydrolase n=1 Tax=Chromobacterium sp. IIBBL 290-4 TaxID=2953890 RepID=UPI0020B75F4F|nr:alpha/beta hydrolase [Chromobacterium sp. IIBBL 290-4]UTH75014.1 alpha/beta hydrolase [Chromobacterium sp. IIBBL 290-4]